MCDLDGTLVDTERSWLDAVRRSVRELGHDIDDATLLQYEGATLEQASSRIVAAYEVSRSAAAIAELSSYTHVVDLGTTANPIDGFGYAADAAALAQERAAESDALAANAPKGLAKFFGGAK